MPKRAERAIWLLGAAALLLLLAGAAAFARERESPPDGTGPLATVAWIDGEPLAAGELEHAMEADKSEIAAYFQRTYGAGAGDPQFWTTSYDGEIPLEALKKQALADSVRSKVQQIEAKKYGLAGDISYRGLLRDLRETNASRRRKAQNHEVVFGPVVYDEQRYMDQTALELQKALIDRLKDEWQLTPQDAEVYYESHKEQFSLGVARTIRAIAADLTARPEPGADPDAASKELEQLQKRIAAGTSFDALYDELKNGKDALLTASENVYSDAQARTDAIAHAALLAAVGKLDAGQTTGIVEDERTIGIYECTAKRALGYEPLEQVRPAILNELAEQKYAQLVEEWVKDAQVETTAAMQQVHMG